MSPSTARRSTRTKNANAHPGGAPKPRTRRTKAQIAADREAEKAVNKRQEVEKEERLTNLAQAEDDIVLGMQAQEASEPRVRPTRPLKRTYAMLNVLDPEPTSDKENEFSTSDMDEKSKGYKPSAHSDLESESMDPASDSASDVHIVEPPKKKRGKSAKASVLNDIQAKRKHLYPIPEEREVEEQQDDALMAVNSDKHSSSHATVGIHAIAESQGPLPFKAGLKKAWIAQRTGDALSEPTASLLAPKASKAKKGLDSKADPGLGPMPTKRTTKSLQPTQEAAPVGSRVVKVKSKLAGTPTEYHAPDNSRPAETQTRAQPHPHPRPRPRPVSKAPQPQAIPETPAPPTAHRGIAPPHTSPLNYGGIPDDETDTEEQEAARLSPIKAGRRITSNTIVSIQPAEQAIADQTSQRSKSFRVLAPRSQLVASSTVINAEDSDDEMTAPANISKSKQSMPQHAHYTALIKPQNKVAYEAEPELVDDSDSQEPDHELESTYDRASVAPSEGPAHQVHSGSRSQSARYDDLPNGVSRDTFKNVFMPTVAKYLVKLSYRDPWTNTGDEYTNAIQCVWDEVFPQIPYKFMPYAKTRCAVTRLINQRTYEWRSKFANAANEAVLDFEASDVNFQDADYRNEWVMWAMKDGLWPFLYADNTAEDSGDWSGTFASELIVKSLTAHLAYTTHAIVIKKLKNYEAKHPIGALALATTAVERALSLWEIGDLDNLHQNRADTKRTHSKFDSSTWTHKAQAWSMSIATLDSTSWNDIINAARSHIKPTSCKPSSYRAIEVIDARAKLVARPRRK